MTLLQTLVVLAAAAALVSAAATPLMQRLAVRCGLFDRPDVRKVHATPTPLLGGVAIFAGVLISLGVMMSWRPDVHAALTDIWWGLVAASSLIVMAGVWDDTAKWPALWKLIGQVAAALCVCLAGIRMDVVTNPLNGHEVVLPPWLSIVVTVVWIVSVINAINLIDGLDGLACGTVAIVACFLLLIAYRLNNITTVYMLTALAGSCLGFLPFNWAPARIFMGDAGSQFLGLMLGVAPLLEFQYKAASAVALLIPLTILAIPISDVALAIVRRLRGSRSIFRADKQHLHHRLLELGLSQRQVVLLMYLMTAYLGLLAILFTLLPEQHALLLLALLGLGLFMGMRTMGFIERRLRYVYLQRTKHRRASL